MRDNVYAVKDLEKALDFLKKHCHSVCVRLEFDELGRLFLHGSDLSGGIVKIIIYDDSTQKMAEIQRTERL